MRSGDGSIMFLVLKLLNIILNAFSAQLSQLKQEKFGSEIENAGKHCCKEESTIYIYYGFSSGRFNSTLISAWQQRGFYIRLLTTEKKKESHKKKNFRS